ncbi:MAG TPA: VWD domain-containing protein [Vicinamibacterales bacterium]|nr:VWD domain-containing protein [Vicinamibacterales bacterium]
MRLRISFLAAAVLAVAAGAAVWWIARRAAPSTPTSSGLPPAATATPGGAALGPFRPGEEQTQRQLFADILAQGVTPERAAWYFSMAIGPLPGASAPSTVKRDASDFDGTAAVLILYQVWDKLTDDQRRAADALIRGVPGPTRVGSRSLEPAIWTDRAPRVSLAGFTPPRGPDVPAHDYATLAVNANKALSHYLNVPPVAETVDVSYIPVNDQTEFAHTSSWDDSDAKAPYPDGKCHVVIRNNMFLGMDDITTASVVTHELVHCYQDRVAGSYPVRASQPPWVAEGSATWVMLDLLPAGNQIPFTEQAWAQYIAGPKTVYSTRRYDGVGVFGHFNDIAPESIVWSRLLDVVQASQGANNEAALNTLIKGAASSYYSSWGPSYFQQAHDLWRIARPSAPSMSGPAPDPTNLVPGAGTQISAGKYQATITNVTSEADLLVVSLLTGYGRLHDSGFHVDTALDSGGPIVLCLKQGGCKCDDGSDGAGMTTTDATAPIAIGIDGGDTVAQVALEARSLPNFCQKPHDSPAPAPPGNGGGGGGGAPVPDNSPEPSSPDGNSTGDPHLETFDGAHVEFQKIGEYTLARSTGDDFVVQVRQVSVSNMRWASVNKAVATKIGGHRATVTYEGNRVVLRLDGKIVTGDPPALAAGTITRALTAFGTNYTFEWPDGTVMHADQLGGYAINVRVQPSAARRGTLEGLLGNDDGKPENDETSVPALANKWLVSPSASLFDYLPGQTSATFVDPSFPDPGDPIRDRAAAERACREQGIADAHLLQDCVVDFGITNGFLFKDQYAHQQAVLAARAAIGLVATPAGAAASRVLVMEGRMTKAPQEAKFTADAGDVIYLSKTPDCVDRDPNAWKGEGTFAYFNLYDPSGNRMSTPGTAACETGRIALPASGAYTMKIVTIPNQDGGPYHVPIHFVRHDRVGTTAYGAIVSGTIEQEAAHDLYRFTAKAGNLIQIAGQGCAQGNITLGITRPDGATVLGPSCSPGSVFKVPETGAYTLLVNFAETGTGHYQFVFQGVAAGREAPAYPSPDASSSRIASRSSSVR